MGFLSKLTTMGDGRNAFGTLTSIGTTLYMLGAKGCELGILPADGKLCTWLQTAGVIVGVTGVKKMLESFFKK